MTLKTNTDTLTLNNGIKVPVIGYGTYKSQGDDVTSIVEFALKHGYRHIDTAARYGNEDKVGAGIKNSGIPRKDIFVTTKLWNTDHKNVAEALDTSLKKLGMDYVDLYLIHFPASWDSKNEPHKDWDFVDTWKQMQELLKTNKVRAIGVSNFTKKKLEYLLQSDGVTVVPAVNQIEAHPLLNQPELYDYLALKNIVLEAHSPLGSYDSPLFKNETINKIAEKNGVTPAQLLISWAVQRKTVVLPKSLAEERVASNIKTFEIPKEDFEELNHLTEKYGTSRCINPAYANFDDVGF